MRSGPQPPAVTARDDLPPSRAGGSVDALRAFGLTVLLFFKHYFRDRTSVFWGLLFPLILMSLIGVAFGRGESVTFTVGVVPGAGPLAEGLRRGLAEVPVLRVVDEADEASALAALRRGRRILVVVPPEAAGSAGVAGTVRVYFDQARLQDARTALLILERFVTEANLRLAGAAPLLRLEASPVAGARRVRFFDFLLPGILAMTVMNSGLQGTSWVVTEYRQRLVLKRVLATPVHPALFLGGLVARYAATNLVQLAVIALVAVGLFRAVIVGSLLLLAALAVLGTLVFVGMGLAVSTVSRTPEAANLLGSLLGFPMMFLAGTFWPREFMPAAVQPLISALPLTPLVEAMRGVAARGDALGPYLPGLVYLAGWGVVAFLLAGWRFRWE
ncbi:MAG: ABC transporter permease [Armatimonadota bacterium]|nr:ABC transporter permease [Armatimonadota bacterium]